MSTNPERGMGPSLGRGEYVVLLVAVIALFVAGFVLLSESRYVWGVIVLLAAVAVLAVVGRSRR